MHDYPFRQCGVEPEHDLVVACVPGQRTRAVERTKECMECSGSYFWFAGGLEYKFHRPAVGKPRVDGKNTDTFFGTLQGRLLRDYLNENRWSFPWQDTIHEPHERFSYDWVMRLCLFAYECSEVLLGHEDNDRSGKKPFKPRYEEIFRRSLFMLNVDVARSERTDELQHRLVGYAGH